MRGKCVRVREKGGSNKEQKEKGTKKWERQKEGKEKERN